MNYFTVKSIEIATSYKQHEWATFVLKELLDNAYEWLNDYYPTKKPEDKEIRKISVRIWMTGDGNSNKFIHIAIRNSNVNNYNEPAFSRLEKIFDYHAYCSTKRNQHRMTCGSLGDALKRCLGMGYATWTDGFNTDEAWEDKQWNEPVIVRVNEKETQIFLKVDTSIPDAWVEPIQGKPTRDIGTDTEVEVTLPFLRGSLEWVNTTNIEYLLDELEKQYLESKIGKFRTSFDFYCGKVI